MHSYYVARQEFESNSDVKIYILLFLEIGKNVLIKELAKYSLKLLLALIFYVSRNPCSVNYL